MPDEHRDATDRRFRLLLDRNYMHYAAVFKDAALVSERVRARAHARARNIKREGSHKLRRSLPRFRHFACLLFPRYYNRYNRSIGSEISRNGETELPLTPPAKLAVNDLMAVHKRNKANESLVSRSSWGRETCANL